METEGSRRGSSAPGTCAGSLECRVEPSTSPAELPYGLRADGTLAHVADVVSGLACGCICLGCGTPLVARKGKVKVHHFAHHADRACAGAWESTLHLLAKEVIAAARSISLPQAVAVHGHLFEHVAAARTFAYDAADPELRMGAITPDIVLHGGGRSLLVEVHVTHPAEDAKLEELRLRKLPAIEIDLSKVPRHAPREHHADLILRAAPRKWLFNGKIEAAVAMLRQRADQEAADTKRRREAEFERVAADAALWWAAPAREQPEWVRAAEDMGAGKAVGVDVPGSRCFAVGPATWQGRLLDHAVNRMQGYEFSTRDALRELAQIQLIKRPFVRSGSWDPDLVALIGAKLPGFATPEGAIDAYVRAVRGAGWITRQPSGALAVDRDHAHRAQAVARAARDRRSRRERVTGALEAVLTAAGRRIDTDRWLGKATFELDGSPLSVADRGGPALDKLVRDLQAMERMVSTDGADPVDDLLGLPLKDVQAKRAKERQAREEARDAATRKAQAGMDLRQRQEAAEFIAGLAARAIALLGQDAGAAWAEKTLVEATGTGLAGMHAKLGFQLRSSLEHALSQLGSDVVRARAAEDAKREAEIAAAALAARCREQLQERASRHFLMEPDRAALWLRARQPQLGGSPWEHCTDGRKLEAGLRLLTPAIKARRR